MDCGKQPRARQGTWWLFHVSAHAVIPGKGLYVCRNEKIPDILFKKSFVENCIWWDDITHTSLHESERMNKIA